MQCNEMKCKRAETTQGNEQWASGEEGNGFQIQCVTHTRTRARTHARTHAPGKTGRATELRLLLDCEDEALVLAWTASRWRPAIGHSFVWGGGRQT